MEIKISVFKYSSPLAIPVRYNAFFQAIIFFKRKWFTPFSDWWPSEKLNCVDDNSCSDILLSIIVLALFIRLSQVMLLWKLKFRSLSIAVHLPYPCVTMPSFKQSFSSRENGSRLFRIGGPLRN